MVTFTKATRHAVKLKIAVAGPSGSGKTLGALALARSLAGASGRIAVIDTENGSASLYGDRFEFDVLNLAPPFSSAHYLEAMQAATDAGYDVLVIDSLSHQWNGEGGILARKEEMDRRPGSNSYTNWATFTKEHTAFISSILQMPVHVITTLRSKQDYVVEQNEKGKSAPKKVGMAPVQREGLEYEFSTVFELQMDHKASASKDRTSLFADKLVDLANPKVGAVLLAWMSSGAPLAPAPRPTVVEGEQSRPPIRGDSPASATTSSTATKATENEQSEPPKETDAPCPKCGGAMWDDRTSKTNVRAPDFKCKDKAHCDGVYWPGQWPPKPMATEEQTSTILDLIAHDAIEEKTRGKIRKALEKGMKAHRADEVIAGLQKTIAEAPVAAGGVEDDGLPF